MHLTVPIFAFAVSLSFPALSAETGSHPTIDRKYGDLPLSFERFSSAEYLARGEGYMIDLRGGSAKFRLNGAPDIEMEFVHGRHVTAIPGPALAGRVNYVQGSDPRRWRVGLPTYGRVAYRSVYPGTDIVYYGNQKQLEFDVVLQPGAEVSSVRMRFKGGQPKVDDRGDLVLGKLHLKPPVVTQGLVGTQGKRRIAARYTILSSGDVGFSVGAYDHQQPLLIDPTIVYSAQVGGGTDLTYGYGIALDSAGNAYIAGETIASDLPVVNADFRGLQSAPNSLYKAPDAFISKINASGTALIYSTYIGGSDADFLQGIAVNSTTGEAWAAGYTYSSDFPLVSPYISLQPSSSSGIVVKLDASGRVAFSTYLGATDTSFANAVAVDPGGNAYVTGSTNGSFPTTPGAFQTTQAGLGDGFVTKFNSAGGVMYSTFLGGPSNDLALGIAADAGGNAYVIGQSNSPTFPGAPGGGAHPSNAGGDDAFIAKLNPSGSALLYFTFLGGGDADSGQAITIDPSGNAYVGGYTYSNDLPVTPGAAQSVNGGGVDGFLAKLNAAGTAFAYVTYLGGEKNDYVKGLAYDASSGGVYITGYTDSEAFPTVSPVQSTLALNSASLFQSTNSGSSWSAFDTKIPGVVQFLTADPSTPGVLVCSTDIGIYRTIDNGVNWTQQSNFSSAALSRSPANSSYIYAAVDRLVLLSTDNGVSWNFKGSTATNVAVIIADPLTATRAYSYDSSVGVYVSADSGSTWVPSNTGLPSTQVNDLVAAPDGSLYAAVYPNGIYKSVDQAGSWSPTNNGLPYVNAFANPGTNAHALAVSSANPLLLYLANQGIVYKTVNGGGSWAPVSGSVPDGALFIAASPLSASIVYASSFLSLVYVSMDGGATWNAASNGLPVFNTESLGFAFDPTNSARAFMFDTVPTNGFVTKVNATGALVYSTYLGGPVAMDGLGIATGATGDAFVTGSGGPGSFPVTPGALAVSGNQYSAFVTKISDATAACSYTLSPANKLIPSRSQTLTFSIVAPSGCAWSAFSNQGWATFVGPPSGSGTNAFQVSVSSNTSGLERSATVSVGPATLTLTQVPSSCGYVFAPSTQDVPMAGGTVQFDVNAGAGCDWTLVNNNPSVISVLSGASGTGNGTVMLSVTPNYGKTFRTLSVQILDSLGSITQDGTSFSTSRTVTITSAPASGVSVTIAGGLVCSPGTYSTPANLVWAASASCTVTFQDPQVIAGVSYGFQSSTVNGTASSRANPLVLNSGLSALTISANYEPISTGGSGTATHLSVAGPGSLTAGTPIQFTVTALDSMNHTVVNYSDLVHFTSSDGAASLPADAILTNGIGTFSASLVTTGGRTITASDLVSPSITGTSASISVSAPSGLGFVPVTPCRLVDTRHVPSAPFISGGTSRNFTIPGNCGIPSTARAFSLNVAVVPHGSLGYITVWPTGQAQPAVATLNALDGRIKSNGAIIPAGTGGAVSVFAANDTDLILDINGYFVPASTAGVLLFYPVTPCRLVDTRHGTLLSGPFSGGTSRTLPILSSTCNVPPTAQGYSLNFVAVAPGQVGFLTAYPTGVTRPAVATLNALPPLPLSTTPVIIANAAVVPAGTGGSVDVFASDATDLVVDINGYFAPPATGGLSLYNLPPCRILDTRKPTGSPPFTGVIDANVLGAVCGGTPQVQSYVFNATVVPSSALGYLTMWPQGTTQPTVATLNALDGTITNNMAIVPTNNTELSAFASNATHLILDMFGYFAP